MWTIWAQNRRVTAIPDDLKELADEYREKLIESVAEHNDSLLEKYFRGRRD